MPNENKRFYWLKLKKDFFKRHDIRIIEAMPNGKDYILFYLKLLVESVDHEGNLRFSETIPYNENMLSVITNTNVDIVKSAMKVFTELNMIELLDDSTIYMNEVEKLIGSETSVAERVRKHRENVMLLEEKKSEPKSNAERQRMFRAKKDCQNKQHIPFIEDYINNKRYNGNYYLVIKRDKYKCSICGSIENLCVHHIDGYDEVNTNNSNANKLLTLCRKCHSNIHVGQEIPQEILESIDYFEDDNECNDLCNTNVTKCNTEKEIEKDIELDKDIDIEKEYYYEKEKIKETSFSQKLILKLFQSQYIDKLEDYDSYVETIDELTKNYKEDEIDRTIDEILEKKKYQYMSSKERLDYFKKSMNNESQKDNDDILDGLPF